MLRVYVYFDSCHMKFELTEADEVLFFDEESNLVAKISADVLLRQLAHAMNGLALETLFRDEMDGHKPPVPLPPRPASRLDEGEPPPPEARAKLRKQRHSRKRGLRVLAALAATVLLALMNAQHVDSIDAMFTLWEGNGVWIEY
jgi:hypothetical protein